MKVGTLGLASTDDHIACEDDKSSSENSQKAMERITGLGSVGGRGARDNECRRGRERGRGRVEGRGRGHGRGKGS